MCINYICELCTKRQNNYIICYHYPRKCNFSDVFCINFIIGFYERTNSNNAVKGTSVINFTGNSCFLRSKQYSLFSLWRFSYRRCSS